MKTRIRNVLLLQALFACLGWIKPGSVAGQTYTTLHNFTPGVYAAPYTSTNSDGAHPYDALILSGNTLYGTTAWGGSGAGGTVFAVNTDGTGFTNLYDFNAPFPSIYTNGVFPNGGLILSGNTLYGTTVQGGTPGQIGQAMVSGGGTVFCVNTDGTGFTNLANFTPIFGPYGTNSYGFQPYAGLVLSGNTLYGTASLGGLSANGTVFAVNTDGTDFTNLYNFTASSWPLNTNSDGAYPYAALTISGNTLYGTADNGGASGNGTLFKINTDGTSFTTLHSFAATTGSPATNNDGAGPTGGLILSGNTIFGTAQQGGISGKGTIFKLNTDGTCFTNLHSFTALSNGTNSDGAEPQDALILSGDTLYGTASEGGSLGLGTVFKVNTNGTGFATLYNFTAGSSSFPNVTAGLILSGNILYGTTVYGGDSGNGSLFSLSLGQLTVNLAGTNIILTWPTNASGFGLQCATNLLAPSLWSAVSPAPVVVNGQNVVTNPVCGTQMFYRLSQ